VEGTGGGSPAAVQPQAQSDSPQETQVGGARQNVAAQAQWAVSLLNGYKTSKQIGIDGKPGYNIVIEQKFGAVAPIQRPGFGQTWQKNSISAVNFFVDKTGTIHKEAAANVIWADVRKIGVKSNLPVRLTDNLAVAPSKNASQTLLIIETVKKKMGFGGPARLPAPPVPKPFKPDPHQLDTLNTDMLGPFLDMTTTYIYVDKSAINRQVALGTIDPNTLTSIQKFLASVGVQWNNLPATRAYESYSILAPNLSKKWVYKP
jgi:hypothetical protein